MNWERPVMRCFLYLLLASAFISAGEAPASARDSGPKATILTRIDTVTSCPGQVLIPVTVENFTGVCTISLILHYNVSVLNIYGYQDFNPILLANSPIFLFNSGVPGEVGMAWYSLFPSTLGSDTLVWLMADFYGGSSDLIWDTLTPGHCEYGDVNAMTMPAVFISGYLTSSIGAPVITSQPSNLTICYPQDAEFSVTASNVTGYQWEEKQGSSWANISDNLVYSGATTSHLHITGVTPAFNNFKYRCLLNGVCNVYSDSALLQVVPDPAANAGPDDTVCEGQSFNCTGTAMNYDSVRWTTAGSGTYSDPVVLNPVYSPGLADIQAGSVNLVLTAYGASSCTPARDTLRLVIIPVPAANAGPDISVCYGDTAMLTASGGMTYTWNTIPPENTQSVYVHPSDTTGYIVTVTTFGCSDSDTVMVNVVPVPVFQLTFSDTICAGENYHPVAAAQHYSAFSWSTSGSGNFQNPGTLNPVYFPGQGDIQNGLVYLVLNIVPLAPCSGTYSDSLLLIIKPLPVAEAGSDTAVCAGSAVVLNGSGGTYYQWSNGQVTPSITVLPGVTTTYFLTVTGNGCHATDSVTVTVYPLPLADAGEDTSVCTFDTLVLTAGGGISYLWSTGETTQSITIPSLFSQTYYVTVTSSLGCKAADSVTVTVVPPPAFTVSPADPDLCKGDSILLVIQDTGSNTYQWSPSAGLSSDVDPEVYASPDTTTEYFLTVTNSAGCLNFGSVVVVVNPLPVVEVSPADPSICEGDSVLLTAAGADAYTWFPATGLSWPSGPEVYASPAFTTTYVVTGTDLNGCRSQAGVSVKIKPIPVAIFKDSIYLCYGDEILLDPGNTLDSCDYTWSDGSTLPYLRVTGTGTIWVKIGRKGCSAGDTILVKPCTDIWVPTAFSPNGDGVNDIFRAYTSGGIQRFRMYIFNRWGQKVFESDNINIGWDGTKDRKVCPIGSYYWLIYYTGAGNVILEQENTKRGNVVLIN